MTDIATISALPIGAFFREGWLPITYRDGKPILTVNGVEHDAEELLRKYGRAETWKEAEARIMQEYRWGNLTPLGVANHLRRAGFRMDVAIEKASTLQEPRHDR